MSKNIDAKCAYKHCINYSKDATTYCTSDCSSCAVDDDRLEIEEIERESKHKR